MLKKLGFSFLMFGIFSFNVLRAQQPMLGEIRMFAGTFAPKGWAFCDGQILPISQHPSLFSILGTTYGGNGQVTFALPDLRGRVAIHEGNGRGLSGYSIGQMGGSETITLNQGNLPVHSHSIPALQTDLNNKTQTFTKGAKSLLSTGSEANATVYSGQSGNGQPVNNVQPYLTVSYIIAIVGDFPRRE